MNNEKGRLPWIGEQKESNRIYGHTVHGQSRYNALRRGEQPKGLSYSYQLRKVLFIISSA